MHRKLDLATWNRREHFEFFTQFDEPYFGLVTEIDATEAYQYCKATKQPFFLFFHYQALRAVNEIEAFRYRISNKEVLIYDTIHLTTTILREDQTFSFSFIPYATHFETFKEEALKEIARVKQTSGLGLTEHTARLDAIHCTTVPWVQFTGITHPRLFRGTDSIPKFAFGKYYYKENRLLLPVNVNVHHGLMDGFHVGLYLELLQELLVNV